MAVVVEPVLTEEKLRSLLDEKHEQAALDYKTSLDVNERRDIVELAKDIAAMQSEASGGYIVVGADDHGTVVPNVTAAQAALFDEATLRNKLKRYLAEPFDIRTAIHTIDQATVVLLYIAPAHEGWCIFKADGEYEEEYPPGSGKKKKKTVFLIGDVFVRHGTASERWQDADRKQLIEQVVARQKETWRSELRTELAAMVNVGLSAQYIEQMPSSAVTWQLDAKGFDQLVTELMRRNDDIPLRNMLLRAHGDAASLLASNLEDLSTLLNRVVSLAALALTYERSQWFARAVESLVRVYELAFDSPGLQRNDVQAPRLWLYVIARVYALGGLAVRLQNWEAVRTLADRLPRGHDFERHYGSWLRHALTMAARANILDEERSAGLIARAHNVVRAIDSLHPDLDPNADGILNSLCQFDALGGLVVIGERHASHRSAYYPNFARYFTERTEPAFREIVTNKAMRDTLFDGDDQLLAEAINDMNRTANHEAFTYNGWDGLEDGRVIEFIKKHTDPEQR
jgi:hypothetical protein